jgi:ABC-type transport system involved in cytochrome bd biosynthesis fused ATPase/permease subunit
MKEPREATFWGIYYDYGFQNPFRYMRFTILNVLLCLCIETIISMYVNKLLIRQSTDEITPDAALVIISILFAGKFIKTFMRHILYQKLDKERTSIPRNIATNVADLYTTAPYQWKSKNANISQRNSIRELFHAYNQVSHMFSGVLQSSIDFIIVICASFYFNISMGIFIIIGNFILLIVQRYLSKDMEKMNKGIGDLCNEAHNKFSNQFANRCDILFNPRYGEFLKEKDYNIVDGMMESQSVWITRQIVANKNTVYNEVIQSFILGGIIINLYITNRMKYIPFIVLYNGRLFGMTDIVTGFRTTANIENSHLSETYEMIRQLYDMSPCSIPLRYTLRESITNYFSSLFHSNKYRNFKQKSIPEHDAELSFVTFSPVQFTNNSTIYIKNMNQSVNDNITLVYNGEITIKPSPDKCSIILLNGPKGCGKSVTMDIIAGLYDKSITDMFEIDGKDVRSYGEFRMMQSYRVYMRQCILDDFKANRFNTIIMSIRQMFPRINSHTEFESFMKPFNILHKLPVDYDAQISKDERGLSPGESQTLMLASNIWKALTLKIPILLLDEPERNIDIENIKNIFSYITKHYYGVLFLITHMYELKQFIASNVRMEFIYNDGIKDINTDKTALTFQIRHH